MGEDIRWIVMKIMLNADAELKGPSDRRLIQLLCMIYYSVYSCSALG